MKKINIDNLISEMTLEEKASLCSAADAWHTKKIERLNLPSVMVSDGSKTRQTKVRKSL